MPYLTSIAPLKVQGNNGPWILYWILGAAIVAAEVFIVTQAGGGY